MTKWIHAQAISTAQYNGWLAAAGQTAIAITCKPVEVIFSANVTSCGPQPRYKDYTINLDGWELVTFSPCYWTHGFVNFNDKPFAYRNNVWVPIEASVVLPDQKLVNTIRYNDVMFFEYDHQSNPAYSDQILNHMNIMADIAAAMNEHLTVNFSNNHSPSTVNVLMSATERYGFTSWFESFKIYGFIALLIAGFLIMCRVCYACGCCGLLWKLCCSPKRPKKNYTPPP